MAKFFYIFIFTCFSILTFLGCNSNSKVNKEKPQKHQISSPIEKFDSVKIPNIPEKSPLKAINESPTEENGCQYEHNMASQGLVNIAEIDPTIFVDLKYSTTDNFVGKDVYDCLLACYLQKKAAEMLANASNFLKNENDSLRLLVYDGGRPQAIQQILWDALPQFSPQKRKTFVADPAVGSIHNYGSAVDLTIADLNGKPLDMGTKYDFFGELAYPKFENKFLNEGKLTNTQIENRQLLRKVMKKAGFTPIEYEWWHFNAVSRAKAKALYSIIR